MLLPYKPARGAVLRVGGSGFQSQARIDLSNPITQGLAYFHMGGDVAPIFNVRGTYSPLNAGANAQRGWGQAGPGINGNGGNAGWTTASSSNAVNFKPNLTQGSAAVFVGTSFTPTDSLAHFALAWGSDNASGASLDLIKFSDNNFYTGFFNGTDVRASGSASGLFNSSGDQFVFGCTYNSSGTKMYVKGQQPFSNATNPATVASTWNGPCCFGGATTNDTSSWCRTLYRDACYWLAFWDRVLNPSEWQSLQLDPWGMVTFAEDDMFALWTGPSVGPGGLDPTKFFLAWH